MSHSPLPANIIEVMSSCKEQISRYYSSSAVHENVGVLGVVGLDCYNVAVKGVPPKLLVVNPSKIFLVNNDFVDILLLIVSSIVCSLTFLIATTISVLAEYSVFSS
jgi:hypothetical protein